MCMVVAPVPLALPVLLLLLLQLEPLLASGWRRCRWGTRQLPPVRARDPTQRKRSPSSPPCTPRAWGVVVPGPHPDSEPTQARGPLLSLTTVTGLGA